MALAHGAANYTPPKPVQRFAEALAALPLWYASAGDTVYAPKVDPEWWASACRTYGPDVSLGSHGEPTPWGWSAQVAARFKRMGVTGPYPDLKRIRELSHRRTTILLHRELQKGRLPYPLPPEPRELTDARGLDGCIMLKMPWSCSGRGVTDCSALSASQTEEIAGRIIRTQGSVMVEPKLNKQQDFALLYHSEGGEVSYCGMSLFFNSSSTGYGGNICGSQEELRRRSGLPETLLDLTAEAVRQALEQILGMEYSGPVGVDMLTYRGEDNTLRIYPAVEVNLRMTMGFVALALSRRFGSGLFRIAPRQLDGIQLIPPNPYFSATFQM